VIPIRAMALIRISYGCLPNNQWQSHWTLAKKIWSVNKCSEGNCVVILLFVWSQYIFKVVYLIMLHPVLKIPELSNFLQMAEFQLGQKCNDYQRKILRHWLGNQHPNYRSTYISVYYNRSFKTRLAQISSSFIHPHPHNIHPKIHLNVILPYT
jgi:hypothetical protein